MKEVIGKRVYEGETVIGSAHVSERGTPIGSILATMEAINEYGAY